MSAEMMRARALANVPTTRAVTEVDLLNTIDGCDEALRAEGRLFFRSAVLDAIARRRREIRETADKTRRRGDAETRGTAVLA